MTDRVTHPQVAPRRGAAVRTWWGRAWLRAVDEAAYAERDLGVARTLARAAGVGAITVGTGGFEASVVTGDGVWAVSGTVPVLDEGGLDALVEAVAAEPGRLDALLGGDLPHPLVEHAEEAGVELLPYGSELATTCTCTAWVDPCPHALAVLHQLAWLVEADPLVLLHLRGLSRDDLLARLHDRTAADPEPQPADDDVDVGHDASVRARRLLELLDTPGDPPLDHLL